MQSQVSLQFSTRFWEHLEQPILGGCTSTDIYGKLIRSLRMFPAKHSNNPTRNWHHLLPFLPA